MSDFTVKAQAMTCLYLFIAGASAGALYDFFSPIRRISKGICALCDVAFCLCAAAMSALALFLGGADSVRIYVLIAFLLGTLMWKITIGRLFHMIFDKLSRKFTSDVETKHK